MHLYVVVHRIDVLFLNLCFYVVCRFKTIMRKIVEVGIDLSLEGKTN